MNTQLADSLGKYFEQEGRKIVFKNKMTLNELALEMWERLGFKEVDASVVSRVIHSRRLFSFRQLRVFCDLMRLNQAERNRLFESLIKDLLTRSGIAENVSPSLLSPQYTYSLRNKLTNLAEIKKTLSKNSRVLFQNIISSLIPAENNRSIIGLKFSHNSYYVLVKRGTQIENRQLGRNFIGFDVSIPYCTFKITVSKLEHNCRCGYHLAIYGVIKEALSAKLYSRDAIQEEIRRWVNYFFPKEKIINHLEKAPRDDQPAHQLLMELKG